MLRMTGIFLRRICLTLLALVCIAPLVAEAQFEFATNNGTLTITLYTGPPGPVVIPAKTNGMPINCIGESAFLQRNITSIVIPDSVTTIADFAFDRCYVLPTITIPDSVISIGKYAFATCTNLTSIVIGKGVRSIGDYAFRMVSWEYVFPEPMNFYFRGDAPQIGVNVFQPYVSTVYYLPGTLGWGSSFGDVPAGPWVLPNPLILDFGPSFGLQGGAFGFMISWATNVQVIVEARTDLISAQWTPLVTNTLSQGSSYFNDPQWMDYPNRFYRIRSP